MVILGCTEPAERSSFWIRHAADNLAARVGSVHMGGFIIARPGPALGDPIMHTENAGPCVIAVLLGRQPYPEPPNGGASAGIGVTGRIGALGHISGTENPDDVIKALGRMRETVQPDLVHQIVLAAGSDLAPSQRAHIVRTIADETGAPVTWAHPDEDDDVLAYSAAIFFPARSHLLLYTDHDERPWLTGALSPQMTYWPY